MQLLGFMLVGMSLLCGLAPALLNAESPGIIYNIVNSVNALHGLFPFPGNSKESAPNPIASLYPRTPTGTLNGTIAVVPIPFSMAREIVPARYRILNGAYESLVPNFPTGSYPLIIRILLDHDVRFGALTGVIPDFQAVHFTFPFVDLLGDGYSSFAYEKYLLITYINLLAIAGSKSYGETPVMARFNPQDEAYAFVPPGLNAKLGSYFLNAYTPPTNTESTFSSEFFPLPNMGPWPFDFYKNITNQPIFANGLACDQQIIIYNTTLSQGVNAPVGVKGQIAVAAPYLPQSSVFTDVYGIKVGSAFIEKNWLQCETLKGYSGP